MAKKKHTKFHVGEKVKWDSEAGEVSGTITAIHTKPFVVHGKDGKAYTRHASKDNPQYSIKSNISDHIANHFGSALHKMQMGGNLKPSFEEYYKTVPLYKNDTSNYDLRAAYNNLPYSTMVNFATNPNGHLPDTYKLPNHPTFSNESIYFNKSNIDSAGHWEGNMYIPYNPKYKDTIIDNSEQEKGVFKIKNGKEIPIEMQTGGGVSSDTAWLDNWYTNRVIPNQYLNGALNLDRNTILNRFNKVTISPVESVDSSNNHIVGQYRGGNSIAIDSSTLNPEDLNRYTDIHEYDHYLNRFPSYTRTTNAMVINDNIKPGLNQTIYSPDEVHARLMQIRKIGGFKPKQVLKQSDIDSFLKKYNNKKIPNSGALDQILQGVKDSSSLLNLLNETTGTNPISSSTAKNGTAITPEEKYIGLNNPHYNEMFFPMKGDNVFRGLDNGQPVQLIDEQGNTKILYGPNDQTIMKGNVMENKLSAKSGIKIKKSHKGLFTKEAKAHNMGVQQFASYVLSHKDKFSSAVVERANFAHNASHFNHGDAGLNILPEIGATTFHLNPQVPTHVDPNYGQISQDRGDFKPDKNPLFPAINPLDAASFASSLIDGLIPNQKYKPLNVFPKEYNSNPFGTGSSAIMQAGGSMSDQDIYNSYAKQLQGNPDAGRLATIFYLSNKYGVSPASITTSSDHAYTPFAYDHPGSGEVKRTTYTITEKGKPVRSFVQEIAGTNGGASNEKTLHTQLPTELASNFSSGGGMNFHNSGDYHKWLGYIHAHHLAENTPGNTPVKIKGKKHKVDHGQNGLSLSEQNYAPTALTEYGKNHPIAAIPIGIASTIPYMGDQLINGIRGILKGDPGIPDRLKPALRSRTSYMDLGRYMINRHLAGIVPNEAYDYIISQLTPEERKNLPEFTSGGGLSRSTDYGSKKHPYSMVSSDDFAGPHRSYPIPTIHDAVDALRLAHMHGDQSVISKVYEKYPSLRKGENGTVIPNYQGMQMPLQFTYGGGAKVISNNPYSISPTVQFVGPSHEDGGIGMQYGNNPVEVEGDETGFIDNSGDMNVMGNMKVPGMKKKFKNAMKDISKKENKASRQSTTASDILHKYDTDHTKFGNLGTNSGKLKKLGADMKQKKLASSKEQLVNIQNQMLDTAHSLGIDPQAMSYGKIKKAKPNGKAQAGRNVVPIFSYEPGVVPIFPNATSHTSAQYNPISELLTSTQPTTPTPTHPGITPQSNIQPFHLEGMPDYLENDINRSAARYGLDPNILQRLIYTESSFNPTAESSVGAKGLVQFMPSTAKKYGLTEDQLSSTDPNDIAAVIDAGAHYLSDLKRGNNDDIALALAAYNGGEGAINFVKQKTGRDNITGADFMNFYAKRRKKYPTDDDSAWQNQTYEYVNKILGTSPQQFYSEGFAPHKFKNPLGGLNLSKVSMNYDNNTSAPKVETLNPLPSQDSSSKGNSEIYAETYQTPKSSYRSSSLPLSEIAPELYAIGSNRLQGVQSQSYSPRLYEPYQVSYQDQLNQNEANFRGLEQLLSNRPEVLGTLAARKYAADNNVLGSEFKVNQGIGNDIINKNTQLLNQADMVNLKLGDEQYARQAQALANTIATNSAALNSISSKVAQNALENKEMAAYSNMFPNFTLVDTNGDGIPDTEQNVGARHVFQNLPSKTTKKAKNGAIVRMIK